MPPYHWWRTVFFLIPAISLYTIVLGTLSIASSLFESSGRFAHWCARTWSRLILVTTGVEVEVSGLEHLQRDRPYVFVANHQSIYDIPIIFWSLPYQIRIIAKESLGRFPFLGWHLRRTGHMLVDRRRPDRAAIFGRASKLMQQGLSLIVFPEGTRSVNGEVGRFKSGIYHLSRLRPDVELIPVYLENLNRILPKGEFLPVPMLSRVVFGPPVSTSPDEGKDEFLARARQALVQLRGMP